VISWIKVENENEEKINKQMERVRKW